MYFIGLDIGTSNIKAILVDESLQIKFISISPNQLETDSRSLPVYNPKTLLQNVFARIKECKGEINPKQMRALSISSMVEAGLPLDRKGDPLWGIIPWNDGRAKSQLEILENELSAYGIYKRTGQPLHTKYPLPKFLWFRKEEPAVFTATNTWLSIGDYILRSLCGESVTDYTQASRTMCFNLEARDWDNDIISLAGVGNIFPQVAPMGTAVGKILPAVARELGLSSDMDIVLGGHDHLMALSAFKQEQTVLDSMGTSEVLTGLMNRVDLNRESFRSGIAQGLFDRDTGYWMASLPSSGASVEWFRNLLSSCGKAPDYSDVLAMAEESVHTGVIYLPYINGSGTPHVNPGARGTFHGITFADKGGDILKSIYEGTGFQLRYIMETLENTLRIRPENLRIVGGGAKNPHWLATKSKILSLPLIIPDITEMSAYGAALSAARHAGISPKQVLSETVICPLEQDHYYEEKYRCFIRLIEQVAQV